MRTATEIRTEVLEIRSEFERLSAKATHLARRLEAVAAAIHAHGVEVERPRRRNPGPHPLEAVMRLRGFASSTDLARAIGVHQTTVSRWLKGADIPRESKAAALAAALQITERELYEALVAYREALAGPPSLALVSS